jgi:imidazolonepropionase
VRTDRPASFLLRDIGALAAVPPGPLRGAAMRDLPIVRDAALVVRDGRIEWFGPQRSAPPSPELGTLSAGGGCVVPGLIDCHTHIPFAGDRAAEFVRRLAGENYLSILESGGGIRVTMQAVRDATEERLVEANLPHLRRMLALGVTTCECKSGYGLSPEHEIKQLRAIQRLAAAQPIELVPTFLGAHALPPEFAGRPEEYIDSITQPAYLSYLLGEGLAAFADAFCDRGAFDLAQTRRYLGRAAQAGLRLKLHADELGQIGASRLAGELRAVSADHLEHIDDAGIAAIRSAGTIAVVLPGTSFFLGIAHCEARRLIDAGLPVALATDFNPGSCMIDSLQLVLNIACCQVRMTPAECLAACTANAAAALDQHRRLGSITPGYDADLTILDVPSLDHWLYRPGHVAVRTVIKRGLVVHEAAGAPGL